jgi:hypothetical protein
MALALLVGLTLGAARAEEKPLTEEQKKRVEVLKKQIAEKKAELEKLEVLAIAELEIHWVPREENVFADSLAGKA